MRAFELSEREAGAVSACGIVLDRLTQVLEEESAALIARNVERHGSFTERKNQLLRELMIAQRTCLTPAALVALRPQARNAKEALCRNQRFLEAHIHAVKEVSAIIVDSIRQADSDGTYSRYA